MYCIKTGFKIRIKDVNKVARLDLFINGEDLYANQNKLYDYDGDAESIDMICDSLSMDSIYNKIINPVISQYIWDYVNKSEIKTEYEETFLRVYKDKIAELQYFR